MVTYGHVIDFVTKWSLLKREFKNMQKWNRPEMQTQYPISEFLVFQVIYLFCLHVYTCLSYYCEWHLQPRCILSRVTMKASLSLSLLVWWLTHAKVIIYNIITQGRNHLVACCYIDVCVILSMTEWCDEAELLLTLWQHVWKPFIPLIQQLLYGYSQTSC